MFKSNYETRQILGGVLIAGTVILGSGCATASPATDAESLLQDILTEDGGPGVMAAVIRDGELIWSGQAGLADMEAGVPMTADTLMRIGSVSKPFTAVLALRLAELGRMDLDADIRGLLPELVEPERGMITPRMIGAHTSGIRHYDFSNILEANNFFFHQSLTDGNAAFFDNALVSVPGAEHHYTSIGFNFLGIAAERAAETDFATALVTYVTGPLRLENTMIDHALAIIPNRTRFYTRFPDGVTRNTYWRDSSDFYPSGGILSTARDLANLTAATFDGEWLSTASMELLHTEGTTTSGEGVDYSFGWQIQHDDEGKVDWFGHGGETNGAYAVVRYYPEHNLAVAGIMNANFAMGEPVFFDTITDDLADLFK